METKPIVVYFLQKTKDFPHLCKPWASCNSARFSKDVACLSFWEVLYTMVYSHFTGTGTVDQNLGDSMIPHQNMDQHGSSPEKSARSW